MKFSLLIFLYLFYLQSLECQQPMQWLAQVHQAQQQLKKVHYHLERQDTLITGDVRHISGEGNADLGGALPKFLFTRTDNGIQLVQSGGRFLFIDMKGKQYKLSNPLLKWEDVEQQAGGQVFVPDFFFLDTSGCISMNIVDSGATKILTLHRSDLIEYDVRNRYKEIVIDTVLKLPVALRLHQETAGKVQDLHYAFSDIKINDPLTTQLIEQTTVPAGFARMDIQPTDNEQSIIGRMAPDFRLNTFEGQPTTLSEWRGKLVLLDFWEVWCGPCLESMPKIEELHKKYANAGLKIFGVLLKSEQLPQAKKIPRVSANHFAQLIGNDTILKQYEVTAIPRYVLIDRNGKIIFSASGYSNELEAAIKSAL